MAYRYGLKNVYRPSQLAPKAYGWTKGQSYAPADVPSQWVDSQVFLSAETVKAQIAYEWFQSGDNFAGFTGEQGLTNPPFVSGAAGRLHPLLQDAYGKPARILRGYIRRAEYEVKDLKSKCRLYFMYNPEIITREYVSYLEQSALDPFNTVYQSKNAIAPPSILNFSFELFFDRQEESAGDPDHPGVFVDYQYFDMVVRNVTPNTDPSATNNTLPDNGVMMVNPRDITVVFSPQLTVQGRPTNAQVTFEKFTHRMTPVRMRIQLQILASYFGPVRDMVEYKQEELPAEETIPIDDIFHTDFNITLEAINKDADGLGDSGASLDQQMGQANDANHLIRLKALEWAQGPMVRGLEGTSLVTEAYIQIGQGETMGWKNHPGTSLIMSTTKKETSVHVPLNSFDWKHDLLPGDILIGTEVIGFFVKYDGEQCVVLSDPAPNGEGEVSVKASDKGVGPYTDLIRPTPLGALGSAAQATSYNSNPPSTLIIATGAGVLTQAQTVVALTGQGNNIRLDPAVLPAWNGWRQSWNGPIPCSSGWRSSEVQAASFKSDPNRFADPAKSYHCKGRAVDVDNGWLGALSASEQTRFRNAALANGWGQARWRKGSGPAPGYECGCNYQNGTKTDEPWHFSVGGCG